MINTYHLLADNWFILDNSGLESQLVAEGHNAIVDKVINSEIWSIINELSHEQ